VVEEEPVETRKSGRRIQVLEREAESEGQHDGGRLWQRKNKRLSTIPAELHAAKF
jgi:hypothetical protein